LSTCAHQLRNSGGTAINDLFYRSARRDSATGHYHFGARTYDPAKATFLTPDSYRNEQNTRPRTYQSASTR